MLGWLISVRRVADEAAIRRTLEAAPGAEVNFDNGTLGDRLAVWQAGLHGLEWIRQAAGCDGGVRREREGGYPHRYLAPAASVLTTIRDRRPYQAPMYEHPAWVVPGDSVLLPGYSGKTTIDDEAIAACPDEEWLYIEVWDES